jgi:hypothetical protein
MVISKTKKRKKRSLIMWGLWAIIFSKDSFAFFALAFFLLFFFGLVGCNFLAKNRNNGPVSSSVWLTNF